MESLPRRERVSGSKKEKMKREKGHVGGGPLVQESIPKCRFFGLDERNAAEGK